MQHPYLVNQTTAREQKASKTRDDCDGSQIAAII